MNSLITLYSENKLIILYALSLATLKGVLFSDFRYGIYSVLFIQVLFPIALAFTAFIRATNGGNAILSRIFICISAIVVGSVISIAIYNFSTGGVYVKDPVSSALFLGSFVIQVIVFLILFGIILVAKKKFNLEF